MFKLVKESLYNFKRENDPIQSSGLGKLSLIKNWLDNVAHIRKYKINDDFTIDVFDGNNVLSSDIVFTINGESIIKDGKLPDYIQFNRIHYGKSNIPIGFFISGYELTTLRGCPLYVSGSFDCSNNELESLEGCPIEVGKNFYINRNKIEFNYNEIKSNCNVGGFIKC